MDADGKIFLKYFGPSVDKGQINIGDIAKSLQALEAIFDTYLREECNDEEKSLEIKLYEITDNCTGIEMIIDAAQQTAPHVSHLATIGAIGHFLSIKEFTKSFMQTLGEQVVLKLFGKGESVKVVEKVVQNNTPTVVVENHLGERSTFKMSTWENRQLYSRQLLDLTQLQHGQKDELQMGYRRETQQVVVATVSHDQMSYLTPDSVDSSLPRERLNDTFDDTKAERTVICGKFMDYYGQAHKYHFSFQIRKNVEEDGKLFILCMVPEEQIEPIIDLLKPKNRKKYVYLHGYANRNTDGKIDRFKVITVSQDADYNPDQLVIE